MNPSDIGAGGRLWSLWDMLKISAVKYIELGEKIGQTSMLYYMASQASPAQLSDSEKADVRKDLTKIKKICEELDLPTAHHLVASRIIRLPDSPGEYSLLVEAVKQELGSKLFLFVESHRARFYEIEPLNNDAGRVFPTAANELRVACRCYAVEQYTACVFHCMRALEVGLKVLAGDLNAALPKTEWHKQIKACEDAIQSIRENGNDPKHQHVEFYSNAATDFRHFKDAWRNHTMHARLSYDEQKALGIMNHVCTFVGSLSSRLVE